MAKMLAVSLMASLVVSVCHGQGYGGVPQGVKGVRTTTTFAPDVIPSDKQAEIFYQQNPNPEDVQGSPQGYNPGVPQGSNPQYNKPYPGAPQASNPQYNKPNPGVPQGSNPQYNKPNPGVPQGSNPQYNKPNPGVPQGSNPQYNKPNPGVPQGSNPQYNKPNPGVPQGSNPQYNKPNPGVPQGSNPQPGGQYPGPLPDNSIYAGSFTDSQTPGGNFWWMNQDNPFKGADVPPQPPKGSSPPQGSAPQPAPQPAPLPPSNNPNNPFLSGGAKPGGPYPAPSGNNPNNPFLSGNKPNNQGCAGGSGCGNQAPQGASYPGNQGVPCTGSGYLCVSKSNCNNGVVVDNGLVVKAGVQRCDVATQVCCRLPSKPNYPGNPGNNGPVKPIQSNPNYQGQGSAPGTNGVPIGGSIYDRPVTPNPVITPYTGPLNVTPYPGCAAALKCVELIYCTVEGVMADTPQALTREQEENRVPLSECSNPDTGILGKCCRDPNYKDPWPGGMMMHVHHEGDHGGQFVDQQGFPTGQYIASQGSPSQQQPNQQTFNGNVPRPFPQKPFQQQQPQQPQQSFQQQQPQQPFPSQQPQQPFPSQQPQQPFPSQQPQQPFPSQQPQQPFPSQQPQQPFPSQQPQQPQPSAPQYQPGPSAPRPNVPPQQYAPQFPPDAAPQQNIPRPAPEPIPAPLVPQYQPQKPDLPPWQPTQVNFASQTPEKVPGYPSPQQQYEPSPNIPAAPVSDQRCGIKGNVDRSGVSDLDVAEGEFPWHAMVLSANGKPLCSAVVVSDRAVLTAAHCVNDLESKEISVSVGGVRLGSQSGYPVVAIARHPKFDAVSQFNDLAVVFLNQPQSGLRPVCLPQNSGIFGGKCIATGYSRKAIQSNSGSLHQVPVYSVPRDVCEQKLKASSLGKYFALNPSFTCALPTNSQASLCKVGAGSPIACERSGVYHLGGTYSWDVGCTQEETPAALAVPDVDWIRSVISRPIADVLREEQNEVEKRKASQEVADPESKPGFSQGYGK